MTAVSLQRPFMHWHRPVPLSRFRPLPFGASYSWSRLFCNLGDTTRFLQSQRSLYSSAFLRCEWLRRTGFRNSLQHPFNPQVLNEVRRGGPQTGVREGGSLKPARRTSTKAPAPVTELPDMVKKERPTGPKQFSLRTTSSHANSTVSFVQILGTGMDTGDTAPCVLLFFDQRRFIFNAGEGLQRFCIEHKIKLSKACNLAQFLLEDHVFLTRVCSETAGGLPGLLLTLAGIGDAGMAVNIWGPSDLQYLVDAMRTFVPNASIVHTHSFGGWNGGSPCASLGSESQSGISAKVLLEDEVVKITAVLLRYQCSEINGATTSAAIPSKRGLKRPRVEQSRTVDSLVDAGGELSVVYVCELPEVKGKFDLQKAQAFFTRAGPHYGQLQAGKSVMASDGVTMVHPSDVMGPSSPGPIFILVDCPSSAYLQSLLSSTELCLFQENSPGTSSKQVTLVVHVSPASVTQDPAYQEWMKRFPGAQHVMAGHGVSNMAEPILKSSARVVSRLNFICPELFSVSSLQPKVSLANSSISNAHEAEKQDEIMRLGSVYEAANLLKFRLRPLSSLGFDLSAVPEPFSIAAVQEQLLIDIPDVLEASKKIAHLWKTSSTQATINEGKLASAGKDKGENLEYYPVEEPWLEGCTSGARSNSGANITPTRLDGMNVQEKLSSEHEAIATTLAELHTVSGDNYGQEDIPACLQGVGREEMEMVFLGTGSSQPSKYRNVSSIYLHLFERGGIMLDCGEGTYAQLKRRYGSDGADDVLAGLKCVWISHIHADHHTGLARILSVRKSILESRGAYAPILVIGPKQLKRFLDAYGLLEDLGMEFLDCSQTTADADGFAATEENPFATVTNFKEVASSHTQEGSPRRSRSPLRESADGFKEGTTVGVGLVRLPPLNTDGEVLGQLSPKQGQMRNYWLLPGYNLQAGIDWTGREKLRETLAALGLARLTSVPVVHCAHAFGVALESEAQGQRPGWKVVYSGDTRPCKALVDASRGATVLIHEATFDDGMPEEALAKKHSLTREAIETGVAARVYRTILTHFSQRYPKIPVFDDSYTSRTCIAFDMMSANLADVPLLPSLLPALKLLFKDELMAVEEGGDDAQEL